METLNRKQYALKLVMTYIISLFVSYIIILIPDSISPSVDEMSTSAYALELSFGAYISIIISTLIFYILVTLISIALVTKRLNDIKVNKIWRVFIIIPIIGQIISILLIFPKSKTFENIT